MLDRIRDIRSSEKVLYRQVLDLYATAVDYDPRSETSRLFFKIVQNKLHYAGVPAKFAPLPVYLIAVPVSFLLVRYAMVKGKKRDES